ncbi:hypothetical protein [Flavimaricola marinus]|uniref:Uncharacterized protein n=1 Tax=Flavimaricola marinus TaxID=1819565 RepID=A0A238LG48_9RHOB|nr:hypothetical protein [Flavimaricola marinus]SMY08588.1 hypothetical protein LOM8899_02742 [Flavimaricola marinus]
MLEPDENGVLLRLAPSAGRRVMAVATIYLLGALLIWMALAQPPALGWAVFLIALGAFILWAAERMRRATSMRLELTEEGLRDSSGRVLADWDEIAKVERGTFAFKPSNGFVLILKEKGPGAWAPGLYWRIGRRVGVGGVTPMRETKFMGEQIALSLAQRQGNLGL